MSNVVKAVLKIDDKGSATLKAVSGAAEDAADNTEQLGKRFKITKDELLKFGAAALAGAAAVGALVKSVADARNQLVDAATQTGLTAQTIAGLKLAAEGSGLGLEALSSGLVDLPKRMDEAKRGTGEALVAFERLGISVTNADGSLRSVDSVLEESIQKLQGVGNSAERAALSTILFGGAGANLMQALSGNELSDFVDEAERFGITVGPNAAAAAGDFQRELAKFELVTTRAKETFLGAFGSGPGGASQVVKAFGALLFGLTAGFKASMDAARSFVGGFTNLLGDVIGELINFGDAIDLIVAGKFRKAADRVGKSMGRITASIKESAAQSASAFGEIATGVGIRTAFREGMAVFSSVTAGTGGGGATRQATALGAAAGAEDAEQESDPALQELGNLLQQQIDAANALIPDTRSRSQIMLEQLQFLQEVAAKAGMTPEATAAINQLREATNAQRAVEAEEARAKLREIAQELAQARVERRQQVIDTITGIGNAMTDPGSALAKSLGPAGGIVSALAEMGSKSPKEIEKQFRQFFRNIVRALTRVIPRLLATLPEILARNVPFLIEGIIKALPRIVQAFIIKLPIAFVRGLRRWFVGALKRIREVFSPGRIFRPETEKGRRRLAVATLGLSEAVRGIKKLFKGSRQTGGFTTGGTGFYMLHAGERVVPSTGATTGTMEAASNITAGQTINIHTNVVDPNAIDQLGRQLDRQFGSRGRSFGVDLFSRLEARAGRV